MSSSGTKAQWMSVAAGLRERAEKAEARAAAAEDILGEGCHQGVSIDNCRHCAYLRRRLADAHARAEAAERGCPCQLATPCLPTCTCAHPLLSGGCRRCARYGSDQQRVAHAVAIVAADVAREATTRANDMLWGAG